MEKTTGAMNLSPMAEAVLDLVRKRPGLSWVEVCSFIEGANGNRSVQCAPNLYLWDGVSNELIAAMNELLKADAIEVRPWSLLVYLADGDLLTLPLATRLPKGGYAKPHWLPTEFGLARKARGRRGGTVVPSGPVAGHGCGVAGSISSGDR